MFSAARRICVGLAAVVLYESLARTQADASNNRKSGAGQEVSQVQEKHGFFGVPTVPLRVIPLDAMFFAKTLAHLEGISSR